MNADDAPVTSGNAQLPATVAPPRSRQPVPVRAPDDDRPVRDADRPLPGGGRRIWWHWVLIGLLVAVSAGLTAVFVVTLATDLLQRHWAQAVDTTREAVPAAVGWGVLFMIFFIGGATGKTRKPPADHDDVAAAGLPDAATQLRAVAEDDAVRQAEECVRSLTARLRMLAAGEHAESVCSPSDRSRQPESQPESQPEPPRPRLPESESGRPKSPESESAQAESAQRSRSLARQVAETSARLERARQWLVSAQAAVAATREGEASLSSQRRDRDDRPAAHR